MRCRCTGRASTDDDDVSIAGHLASIPRANIHSLRLTYPAILRPVNERRETKKAIFTQVFRCEIATLVENGGCVWEDAAPRDQPLRLSPVDGHVSGSDLGTCGAMKSHNSTREIAIRDLLPPGILDAVSQGFLGGPVKD